MTTAVPLGSHWIAFSVTLKEAGSVADGIRERVCKLINSPAHKGRPWPAKLTPVTRNAWRIHLFIVVTICRELYSVASNSQGTICGLELTWNPFGIPERR